MHWQALAEQEVVGMALSLPLHSVRSTWAGQLRS